MWGTALVEAVASGHRQTEQADLSSHLAEAGSWTGPRAWRQVGLCHVMDAPPTRTGEQDSCLQRSITAWQKCQAAFQ